MPRNVYFSQAVRSEQNLYEDLVIESLKIFGQDVYYIPRTLVNRDSILNEDPASNFDDAYLMEAYIENVDGFEGAGDLYQKFGLEIRDEASFVISRKAWNNMIGGYESQIRPQEGDLLFLPMTNSFFEITFVEHDKPFYQLSNLPVYKLTCSLFEYNDEKFETGLDVIDDTMGAEAYLVGMDVSVTAAAHFAQGEVITQTLIDADGDTPAINVFGTVQTIVKTSDSVATLVVSNVGVTGASVYRPFVVSGTKGLVGAESANTCYITKVYDINDADTDNFMANDGDAQNIAFEVDADNFIDFTESNPFGDPT